MLVQTISQYLGSHKRLVVPQLGTFIVKEPGVSIVFSELLKRDDGVLRGLLRAEVRHAAQHGQEFRLDGFGVLHPGPNGTIAFAYEPRPAQPAASDTAAVPAGTQTAPVGQKPPKLPYSEPRVSPSAKMNPDPSVRGLRYGKPPKTTAAYSYVDRPPRRRRADRFIWVAVIAAAIAVAAIAFGYLREANDKEAEMQYLEQPADPQPATDTGAATPEQPITE